MDKETGYYYYNARHYDAEISRFLTADSVVPYEMSTQSWNRYGYCRNNPIQYKDPTGHWDDDVHEGKGNDTYGTIKWATDRDVGFSKEEAKIIGAANKGMDSGDTSPLKKEGQQYHFNTNNDINDPNWKTKSTSGTKGDSRIQYANKQLDVAIKMYNEGSNLIKTGNEKIGKQKQEDALKELGKGLHSKQDDPAHSDDQVGVVDNMLSGGKKWSHYFKDTYSGNDLAGGKTDSPKDRSDVLKQTEKSTKEYLNSFREEVGLNNISSSGLYPILYSRS